MAINPRGFRALSLAKKLARRSPRAMLDSCLIVSTSRVRDPRGGSSIFPDEIPEYELEELVPCRVEERAGQERTIDNITMSVTVVTVSLFALKPDGKTPVVVATKDRIYVLPRHPIPMRVVEVETVGNREGVKVDVVGLLRT